MRIAIIGAGAMGRLFGTRLADAGAEVVMIDADPRVVAEIRAHGMTVHTEAGTLHARVQAAVADEVRAPVEVVMVLTKTLHSEAAVHASAHLISDRTIGVSVQNGLGNERPLAAHFGPARTVIGMTSYPADRRADGSVASAVAGQVIVGGLVAAAGPRARAVADLFEQAGFSADAHHDIRVPIWEKAVFNAALNTISAATGLTVGAIGGSIHGRSLVEGILAECFAVAEAEGIALDARGVRAAIDEAFRHHGDHRTSMLVDVEQGRPTEVESIGGAIAAVAREHGLQTPVLSAVSDIVRLRGAEPPV